MVQADDAEAEAAKRETLGAALAAFVAAVRRDRSPVREGTATPTAAELLGPEGKLGLSHILPIYKECAAELVRGLGTVLVDVRLHHTELLSPEGKLGLSPILPIYKECAAELVRQLHSYR